MKEDFKEYLKEARQEFCKEVNKHNVSDNLELRTKCDSFLIAFDQAVEQALTLTDVVGQSEQLSKRPNTSSTWECFTRAEKQNKGNV